MSCDNLHVGPENPLNVLCFSDAARRRPYPLIAHCSQLITQNLSHLRHPCANENSLQNRIFV